MLHPEGNFSGAGPRHAALLERISIPSCNPPGRLLPAQRRGLLLAAAPGLPGGAGAGTGAGTGAGAGAGAGAVGGAAAAAVAAWRGAPSPSAGRQQGAGRRRHAGARPPAANEEGDLLPGCVLT